MFNQSGLDKSLKDRVTAKEIYMNRRELIAGSVASTALLGINSAFAMDYSKPKPVDWDAGRDSLTPLNKITNYNNFYEFGLSKEAPAINAQHLSISPWPISIEGECKNPQTIELSRLLADQPLEERIYRHRCVEGWSMVIPWVGFSLKTIIELAEPKPTANFVTFKTLYRPNEMIGQRGNDLLWPYREALRMDEAMHPLTILAVGLYGDLLPKQDGAPIRLVVPWKYGFKSIKSIVSIGFQSNPPSTTWNLQAPNEYGFYANVNPNVDHPRWSQAKERRIGEFFKRATLPFNGYSDQVSSLYSGQDLTKDF